LGEGWEKVETADRPTDEALLALAARLCNKPAPE
jgi:uroporphyrinogen-III synthase